MAFWAGYVCSNIMGLYYFWLLLFLSFCLHLCLYTHTHTYMYISLSLILFHPKKCVKPGTIIMDLTNYLETFHRIQHTAAMQNEALLQAVLSLWNYKGRWQYRSSTCSPYKTVQPKWRIRWKAALLLICEKQNQFFSSWLPTDLLCKCYSFCQK